MNSSDVSMELSVSFVSWINEHLREEAEVQEPPKRVLPGFEQIRSIVFASVACVSLAIATLLAR